MPRWRRREAELDAADAIVFGSPTYMGGVSADFAKFKDWTSKKWMARAWQDKLAAGFTVSASWGGDKQNTLYQLLTLAQQQGMVWVGLGLAPGYNHSKGSPEDLNRTGASLGVMAPGQRRPGQRGHRAPASCDREALGKRVAEAARAGRTCRSRRRLNPQAEGGPSLSGGFPSVLRLLADVPHHRDRATASQPSRRSLR